jgi:hypothetical protein
MSYLGGPAVHTLPATGAGIAVVTASDHTEAMVAAVVLLSAWTLLAAGRAAYRLVPKKPGI